MLLRPLGAIGGSSDMSPGSFPTTETDYLNGFIRMFLKSMSVEIVFFEGGRLGV